MTIKKDPEDVALIDLDGTTADFEGAMNRDMAKLTHPAEINPPFSQDAPWIKARRALIKNTPGWWANLPRIPRGFLMLQVLRECRYDLMVLTKGPESVPTSWAEKVEWAQEHIPDAGITLTQNKGLVYGRVLFDDWPPYIEGWLTWRPRGTVIMPDHPYNQDAFRDHPNVIRYHGEDDLDRIKERLLAMKR